MARRKGSYRYESEGVIRCQRARPGKPPFRQTATFPSRVIPIAPSGVQGAPRRMKGPSGVVLGGGFWVVLGGFVLVLGVVFGGFLDVEEVVGGGSTMGSSVVDGGDGGATVVDGSSKVGIRTSGFAAGPAVHAVSVSAASRPLTIVAFARAGIQERKHTGKSGITPTFCR
jgi:hypothetical protein